MELLPSTKLLYVATELLFKVRFSYKHAQKITYVEGTNFNTCQTAIKNPLRKGQCNYPLYKGHSKISFCTEFTTTYK